MSSGKHRKIFGFTSFFLFILTVRAHAYIGPGAGFAFLGSAFVFVIALIMAFITIAIWPIKWVWKKIRGKRISKNAKTRRLIVLGLDGLDPNLCEQYMREGKLPNLKALSEKGGYSRLATTFPSISPVAWSTFQTGVNPGAHNIYDFLTRDKRNYLPDLSSLSIRAPKKKFGLGPYDIPLGKPEIRILRKSQPFWKILGQNGIFSHILRVPITCPPEPFEGNLLSGMSTPDLKGSQGTFSYFSSSGKEEGEQTGGAHLKVERKGSRVTGLLEGPDHPFKKKRTVLKTSFRIDISADRSQAMLIIGKEKIRVELRKFSDWVRVEFDAGWGIKIAGICRFYIRKFEPEFEMYVSPINIDPEKPSMPISHPNIFSIYLAKLNGLFGTLGLMEDTWARNERVLDDEAFLAQAYLNHDEREKMFFDAVNKTKEGVCVCVFDASDRVQHMFWRYIEKDHPAPIENEKFRSVIPEMYQKMDDLVGRTSKKVKEGDVFIVLSDHGFSSFKRCVNVNTWLMKEGYLKLKNDQMTGADHFQDVDWDRTKAFAVGMSGIYFNRIGREKQGIVTDEEARKLKKEISAKLLDLKDPANGNVSIKSMGDTDELYKGVYKSEAPDLIVGYAPGYRISWESVTGKMKEEIFEDNVKAWSGDHSIDADSVPGVLFANRRINKKNPNMLDLAPTALDLFAVKIPSYMEGKPLL